MTQELDASLAARLIRLTLGHVTREYPNKLDHVLACDEDAASPRALHPVFYGSYDWHSCVHGWWTLFTLARFYPDLPEASEALQLAECIFSEGAIAGELAYLARPGAAGFERPYGWAWLLMLAAELHRHRQAGSELVRHRVQPLAKAFADRFKRFLPHSPYPVRVGTHPNTAFALRLALEYAREVGDGALEALCIGKARDWYASDRNCPVWEPSQEEFLSPALIEAECMRQVLPPAMFADWFDAFLHDRASLPLPLLDPPSVTDRSDGKIAHLDGLSFSRAWCLRGIAEALGPRDPRSGQGIDAAKRHIAHALPHIEDDYMGSHWLGSFVVLAMAGSREMDGR
jgi:hypothetical protein